MRRLTAWFNDKFFAEVSGPLVMERCYKRYIPAAQGGGSPDTDIIRAARVNIRYHLAYIGWLVRERNWLAGDQLSLAEFATAARLYRGRLSGRRAVERRRSREDRYARVKSRPSFRPILTDTMPGIPASKTYADLDL